jgi:hypothetical protein
MATCTATFTQDQYEPGATIRCDFTWSGGFYCNVTGYYARVAILDAYDNELAASNRQTASGTHYLTYLASNAGTYKGRIYVYGSPNCQSLCTSVDTCLVQSTTNYTLTLVNSPSNSYGSIELVGHGTCPSTCSFVLPGNQLYGIEAHPDSGYVFSYWSTTPSGGCTSSSPTCTFTLNGNKTITAHFIVGSVNLTRSKSCDAANQESYCFYGSNPPLKSTFECYDTALVFSQIDSGTSLLGKTWTMEWWHSAVTTGPVEVWDLYMDGDYTGWWSCYPLNPCLTYGAGTCHIKHYVEGAYIGSSNTFTYNPQPNTVIAELNPEPQSVYDSGPYYVGQQDVNIASISIKNVGSIAGTLQYRCYIYANEAGETLLLEGSTTNNYNPGQSVQQPLVVDLPSGLTPGYITFGVKVKGQTETTWPAWGALGTLMWRV